jgi:hypothetical protein
VGRDKTPNSRLSRCAHTCHCRWENKFYPIYFFPQSELSPEFIELASKHPDGDTYDLLVGTTKAVGAVTVYSDPTHQHLNGLLKINFK